MFAPTCVVSLLNGGVVCLFIVQVVDACCIAFCTAAILLPSPSAVGILHQIFV